MPAPTRPTARGQALVEFALLVTVLVLLVAGATDEAMLLNDHLNVVYAARQGARTAAVLGQASNADCAAVGAVQAALANDPNLTVTGIVIYQSSATGQPTSPSMEDSYAGNTQCVVTNGTAAPSPAALSVGWPPSARNDLPYTEDSVGVQINYSYQFQFQLLGSGALTSSDYCVMPIEVVVSSIGNPGNNSSKGGGGSK